jgi:hypothetical protein
MEALLDRPAWFVAGPLLGVVVVAVLATLNERLGVIGGYGDFVDRASGRQDRLGWKGWFVVGIVVGGAVFSTAAQAWGAHEGYAWLENALGRSVLATGALLAGAGVLIGLGAKTAGGCTSGNGLSGCAFASPASLVATATFMATAVGTAFVFRWLLGGG